MIKILNFIINTMAAFLASWIAAQIFIPLAEAERGYSGAYGGEWFLIIAVFVGTYYLLSRINKEEVYRQ